MQDQVEEKMSLSGIFSGDYFQNTFAHVELPLLTNLRHIRWSYTTQMEAVIWAFREIWHFSSKLSIWSMEILCVGKIATMHTQCTCHRCDQYPLPTHRKHVVCASHFPSRKSSDNSKWKHQSIVIPYLFTQYGLEMEGFPCLFPLNY